MTKTPKQKLIKLSLWWLEYTVIIYLALLVASETNIVIVKAVGIGWFFSLVRACVELVREMRAKE